MVAESPRAASGELQFYFEKSTQFRVVHVDGAFGGLSPGTHMIHMAVFSERTPLPQKVIHTVNEGILGPEIKREGKEGVFREIEVDLVMSASVAIALRDWLDQKITESLAIATQAQSMGMK